MDLFSWKEFNLSIKLRSLTEEKISSDPVLNVCSERQRCFEVDMNCLFNRTNLFWIQIEIVIRNANPVSSLQEGFIQIHGLLSQVSSLKRNILLKEYGDTQTGRLSVSQLWQIRRGWRMHRRAQDSKFDLMRCTDVFQRGFGSRFYVWGQQEQLG